MNDCKHEHIVHCPVCDTVRCADCGKVWTFEQDPETTPALWPQRPLQYWGPYWQIPPATCVPQPWEPRIYGTDTTGAPPLPSHITITCGGQA